MSSSSTQTVPLHAEQEANEAGAETNPELYQSFADLVSSFPRTEGMAGQLVYRHAQGWHTAMEGMVGSMVADACFAARPSDIIVATLPKSGTTWIKALLYATVRRGEHPPDAGDHPFHSAGPHECVSFLECQLYTRGRVPDLAGLPADPGPRLFATHLPFAALPRAVAAARCRVVYVCRDPKDTLVSLWHFVNSARARGGGGAAAAPPLPVQRAAELFCAGVSPFGPYWDHVLGYWRAHLARPDAVLFFRYEEMRRDPAAHVRRLAAFAGCPFVHGGEDAVVRLCSFEHMTGLEATRRGTVELAVVGRVENSCFFRRGVVGDWANHLSPETARRIDAITEEKFKDSGLSF